MKVNNNTELKQDNYAAIGIGAMIVFISLILIAPVASAVIIQTAEKLQQNAQKTGDDTASELRAKINVLGGYLDDQGNDNYVLLVKLESSFKINIANIVIKKGLAKNKAVAVAKGIIVSEI
jgi:archaellin